MELDGIHHITAITGDAPRNVKFYAGVLGLRLVKKTVNQDDPTVYHLFYADAEGSPGSDLTFFEYPGASRGCAGEGMVHRICWRVGSSEALDFWARRLAAHGTASSHKAIGEPGLLFRDPEGLEHELLVADVPDEPLIGDAPDVPAAMALQGFDAVRVYSSVPERSALILGEVLGFSATATAASEIAEAAWEVRGPSRGGRYLYDPPPPERPLQGAGTVHHVAFATQPDEQQQWQQRLTAAGLHATQIIDRFYFRSVYFREPSGVLMELATIGPGFAVDEDAEHLGQRLSLPPRFESLRSRLEETLTPLPDPHAAGPDGPRLGRG